MANTIKLKRGSGSDPSASDLEVGELAIRTDSGKIFTKKDNGSVAEISGGGGIDDGDKGDITVANGGDTFTIDNGVVTSAKIADGTIVNADINASAAIAGSKISPTFTSNFTATGTEHKFTSGTSGDCKLIIEADSDNNNEADNPLIALRQDGGIDVSAIGHNFSGSSSSGNELFISNSVSNGGIVFYTGATNGYTNGTERLRIAPGGQITGTGNLTLTSTAADSSAAPIFELYRNSASPADADYLGQLKFTGESDDGSKEVYAKVTGKIDDASSGTEDGLIEFALRKAGSNNIGARLTSEALKLINGTNLEFPNGGVIKLGDSDDLQLFHDGSTSRIQDSYGHLLIGSNIIELKNAALSETYISCVANGAVSIRHDNVVRLATTSAGIDVTGSITGTGDLTIDTNTLHVDSANNRVGIGTTSPSIALEITKNGQSGIKITDQAVTNASFEIRPQTGNSTKLFRIIDSTASADRLTINASGTVNVAGSITLGGTVDGVDIAARDTLFGGLTSSSGVLTNGVTATTQSAGNSTTRVATTAFVSTAIANLIDSSPSTLNTLNELAAALGDDPNFATTVTNSIATKLPLAGGTLTGDLTVEHSGHPTILIHDTSGDNQVKVQFQTDSYSWSAGLHGGENKWKVSKSSTFGTNDYLEIDGSGNLGISNNISVGGLVDGRDVASDGSKLDTIESNATADQTASEILTLLKTVDGAGSGLDADTLDGVSSASFIRGDSTDNGATTIKVNDADFIVQDSTDSVTNFIWRDHSGNKLYIGTAANAVVTPRSNVVPNTDSTYNLGANGTRWANIYGDQLYGAGSNITALNASNLNSGTVAAARLPQQESGTSIVGNFGQWQAHSTYNNFNTEPAYWGWNYINGNNNAPNTTSDQWYRCRLSLGSEYGKGSGGSDYSLEMALPRYNHSSAGVLHIRTIEAGSEGSWTTVGNNASLITTGTLPAARLPNHSASLLTSGTIPAARVPTLNQNTTGSAATLTTARTIAGVSFDGSANISLNNNAITNGAGYITASNAAITNKLPLAGGTMSGDLNLANNVLYFADANTSNRDHIWSNDTDNSYNFCHDTTRKGTANSILKAASFQGSGASLTSLNASNISSGTIAAARVPTLNQNTTGSSGSCTGNSATATKLATARTIAGVSFDGSANISLNNNAITNGAGYINATNSAVTNKLPLAGGTMTGELQINARLDVGNGSGNDHEIRIYKGDNNVSDHIQFYNGTTRIGEIGCEDGTWLRINQETNKNIYTPRYIRADAGFFVDGTSKGINGSGNFIGGTIAGASDYSTLLRSNTADTATGDITFSGGAGAVTIAANSDIRLTSGNWTGNAYGKIQHHSNRLYISGGSNSNPSVIFRDNASDRIYMKSNGTLYPATDSAMDLGVSNYRWANGYFDTLYGDGSNLTGISAGATGGGSDEVFYENDQTVTTNYTITNGKNAMAAGPITINSGVTVTVGSGETLTIV